MKSGSETGITKPVNGVVDGARLRGIVIRITERTVCNGRLAMRQRSTDASLSDRRAEEP